MALLEYYLGNSVRGERDGERATPAESGMFVRPDRVLLCDALGAQVLRRLAPGVGESAARRHGIEVYATCGRNFPPRDVATANSFAEYRRLAAGGTTFLGPARAGVPHNVLAESAAMVPGELLVGTDSHTPAAGAFGVIGLGIGVEEMVVVLEHGWLWLMLPPSIRITLRGSCRWPLCARDAMFHLMRSHGPKCFIGTVMEFWDRADRPLNHDERMVFCSLATECGAVTSFFATAAPGQRIDELEFVAAPFLDREGYAGWIDLDCAGLAEPLVAWPADPFNLHTLADSAGIAVSHCVVGTCSGGGLTGMREAAEVLRGHRVHPGVTMLVVPQSQGVYLSSLREGLLEVFLSAGATVTTPTCGPCLASHSGVLASSDVCVFTGNRNYRGRMGDPGARIYLGSPRVAARAAIAGEIRPLERGSTA